jgi:transketolase
MFDLTDRHESQRGYFSYALYKAIENNPNIILVTADLGYGIFDKLRNDFPNNFINTGASEQLAMGICVGLAESGKIPVFYSISPFGVFRPIEWIRNYVNHESCPVRIVLSGGGKDYAHDGFTHFADDIPDFLALFKNIKKYYPTSKEEAEALSNVMFERNEPSVMILRR